MPPPDTVVLTAKERLGAALGRIPSGLFILTLRHGERQTGLLLSWAQQCAFAPPMVSFAVREERYQLGWLKAGAAATLHVLSGRLALRLDERQLELGSGDLVTMEAGLPHAGQALSDTAFLLTLVEGGPAAR